LAQSARLPSSFAQRDMRVLTLIPPMTQLNTPYPASAYLTGFLRSRGWHAEQRDLALALALRLLSSDGLNALRAHADRLPARRQTASVRGFLRAFARYHRTIDATVRFLQGGDSTLAHRIVSRQFLPEGPRFQSLRNFAVAGDEDSTDARHADPLAWAFGALGLQDHARHLATLYLNDIADVVRDAIDPRFEFVRYAESLAQSQASFAPLARALAAKETLLDRWLHELTLGALAECSANVVLLSTPFPGSVYAAFRMAQSIKAQDRRIVTVLGGGYVNTELRQLREPRVFDYFDYVTLDGGERPLLNLLEHLQGERPRAELVRTYFRSPDRRVTFSEYREADVPFAEVGTPTWEGLPLTKYLSLLDLLNPMHRLWSDGRWNKLTVAHGCYWKKCAFCDVSLDYISRYETANATILVDRIANIVAETGQTGFHFVDEAAPPKALKALAHELLRRKLDITWWGNIRFEKTFTPELCQLLASSGCVAISGGLEVASDRLLRLMQKGVSVAQVARVTKAFSDAGILVHAYLMYGFPTQTVQDTVDALEYVRQLFAAGCIQSGYFHRFTCTVHSPVGRNPQAYGVRLARLPRGKFAHNDIGFIDPSGVDHARLGRALSAALYNYMHGVGLERDVREWFDRRVPKTSVPGEFISQAL
jgi:hypothetical protein